MSNHRTLKQKRARKALIAGVATAGVSGAFALAQTTDVVDHLLIDLTSTTYIGIGGQGNPTSDRVKDKLNGTVFPTGSTPVLIQYPASLELGSSRDIAVPLLDDLITPATGDQVQVVSYSEGTLVAEQEKRNLYADQTDAPLPADLTFTQIASPFAGNGGIFARFPETPTFLLVDNMGAAQPSQYDTHYVTNEYDPYGDFPAYANPLSLANSLLAVEYAHPDQYYDAIDPATSKTLGPDVTVPNGGGGQDTYTLYYNPDLPLLAPIRQVSSLIGTSQYTEPALDLVEPSLRVLIDMGYTDRTNADPETVTPFSLITPPQNIIGAAAALPGAIVEGVDDASADLGGISPLAAPAIGSSQNKLVVDPPAPKPLAPAVPKLPKLPDLLPLNTLSQTDKPADEIPSTKRPITPNLGTLLSKPAKPLVFAGGVNQKSPSFGGGHVAGVVSGALKGISDALKPKASTQ